MILSCDYPYKFLRSDGKLSWEDVPSIEQISVFLHTFFTSKSQKNWNFKGYNDAEVDTHLYMQVFY
jgi:hypothetical protein